MEERRKKERKLFSLFPFFTPVCVYVSVSVGGWGGGRGGGVLDELFFPEIGTVFGGDSVQS